MTSDRPLRIGIVIPSLIVAQWRMELIRRIVKATDEGETALLLLSTSHRPSSDRFSLYVRTLSRMYASVDSVLLRHLTRMRNPFHPESALESFPSLPIFDLDDTSWSGAEIRELDLVLCDEPDIDRLRERLGSRPLLLGMDDMDRFSGSGLGLVPMVAGLHVVSGRLLADDARRGRYLQSIWYTSTSRFSLYFTYSRVLWRTVSRVAGVVADFLESVPDMGSNADESVSVRRKSPRPTLVGLVRLIVTLRLSSLKELMNRMLCYDEWFVGIRSLDSSGQPSHPPQEDLEGSRYSRVTSGRKSYLADPFVIGVEGKRYLFVEEFLYAEGKGVISCAPVASDGSAGSFEIVLKRPGHLSYPFVFADGDGVWMIPESSEDGGIHLFKADPFPSQWVLERTLIPGLAAVDSTLLQRDGLYWLFTNPLDPDVETTDDLCIYWAESLDGLWTAHSCNPVVSDPRRARGAGTIVTDGSGLVRPSQDGAEHYGRRIRFNRIRTLTREVYEEEEISAVEASWPGRERGLHTWNRAVGLEVIDGATWHPRWTRKS